MGWGVEHVGLGPQPMGEHPNESVPDADRRVEPCGHRDTWANRAYQCSELKLGQSRT